MRYRPPRQTPMFAEPPGCLRRSGAGTYGRKVRHRQLDATIQFVHQLPQLFDVGGRFGSVGDGCGAQAGEMDVRPVYPGERAAVAEIAERKPEYRRQFRYDLARPGSAGLELSNSEGA